MMKFVIYQWKSTCRKNDHRFFLFSALWVTQRIEEVWCFPTLKLTFCIVGIKSLFERRKISIKWCCSGSKISHWKLHPLWSNLSQSFAVSLPKNSTRVLNRLGNLSVSVSLCRNRRWFADFLRHYNIRMAVNKFEWAPGKEQYVCFGTAQFSGNFTRDLVSQRWIDYWWYR